MRIVLSGGGTFGHVAPAIAIGEEIIRRHRDACITFIGREGGDEYRAIGKTGFDIRYLSVRGLRRSFSLDNLGALSDAIKAKRIARELLDDIAPVAVIGTGGYSCWPVLSAAHSAGIYTALHESNAVPGLASRLLMKKCDAFLMGCKMEQEPKNAHLVGNPIRKEFFQTNRKKARYKLGLRSGDRLIVSLGGSLGADRLNTSVIDLMKSYSTQRSSVIHVHSAGKRYYSAVKASHPELCKNSRCNVLPYIENVAEYMCAADLIISRCGAMTLAEIAYSGVPSILIPSPNVTNDHQRKNANAFAKAGASEIIEDAVLSADILCEKVDRILSDSERWTAMSKNARHLSIPNAAELSVDIIENDLRKRGILL